MTYLIQNLKETIKTRNYSNVLYVVGYSLGKIFSNNFLIFKYFSKKKKKRSKCKKKKIIKIIIKNK